MFQDAARRLTLLALVAAGIVASAARTAVAEPGPPHFGQSPRPGPIEVEYRKISPWLNARVAVSDETGFASADSLVRAAAERHEILLFHAARFFRGRHQIRYRQFEGGFADLDSVLVAARARKDTTMMARVWASRGHGYLISGRHEESKQAFAQAAKYCKATQSILLEGFVHRGLGGIAKQQGRLAEAEREFTIAIEQVQVKSQEYLNSRLQRAEIWKRRGQHERAKAEFEAILHEARARGDRFDAAAALHDLGNMAYEQQDMAAAARNWAVAAATYDSIPDDPSYIAANLNRAQALIDQGRHEEALGLLAGLEKRARETNSREAAAAVGIRGRLLHRMGRLAEAEAALVESRVDALGHDAMQYDGSTVEYASVLTDTGRPRLAESVLDSLLAPRGVEMAVEDRAYAWMEKSRARTRLDRPREALAAARQAERLAAIGRTNGSYLWLDASTVLARCQRATGAPDSAVATLARAARTWEKLRSTISNYEWRERYGSGLSGLFAEYGLALLDPRRKAPPARREREAFDVLQAFQARTLEERMQGAGLSARAMTRRASADSLRRGVLHPGEVLLDLVATPDTTFAFALSREGLAVALLPGANRLERPFDDWKSATLANAQPAVVERGLERLSKELVAPLARPLARARRVIVSGGGALALWPIAALTLPGESAPLGATREVVATPSATLFALLRSRGGARAAAPQLLALGRTTTADGKSLPGANRELRDLGSSYAGVTVRENKGDRTLAQLTADLGKFDALHFSAHSEAVESAPWRSGFLLGKGASDDAYLRAAAIARMKLKARVAVLSSCSSAGASSLAGEGALGLSSGFLCAGTTSVVATLWPVDDRTAQRFVDELYDELAKGKTIAAAPLGARGALRAHPETSNARDWAAFVVIGEPGTTLPLKRKGLL
jgi:CHAT domain-containing protein/tetratricopeptide (TPR) repeat protein